MFAATKYLVFDFANLIARSAKVKMNRPISTAAGYPTQHIFLSYNSILSLKKNIGGKLVFALEGEHQHEKYELFDGYKANRLETREAIDSGKEFDPRPDVKAMVAQMKCLMIHHPNHEADDAIATFVKRHPNDGIMIISNDRDLWYLLKYPKVKILRNRYDGKTKQTYQEEVKPTHVFEDFGVKPHDVPFVKALYGDVSDNTPKIPSLGDVAWKELAAAFTDDPMTPERFFPWVEANCSEKLKQLILDHKEQVEKMYKIIKLNEDLDLTESVMPGDKLELRKQLEKYECKSLYNTVDLLTS